jgi:hypothetical protein
MSEILNMNGGAANPAAPEEQVTGGSDAHANFQAALEVMEQAAGVLGLDGWGILCTVSYRVMNDHLKIALGAGIGVRFILTQSKDGTLSLEVGTSRPIKGIDFENKRIIIDTDEEQKRQAGEIPVQQGESPVGIPTEQVGGRAEERGGQDPQETC